VTRLALRTFLLSSLAASAPVAAPAHAQVSLGADIVSRYVWRGIDFGDSWSIQPGLSFAGGGFEVGAWASYAMNGTNESDLYVSYTIETESGATFSLGATDYYFPDFPEPSDEHEGHEHEEDHGGEGPPKFLDWASHDIEPYLSFAGPERFPLELTAAVLFADKQSTLYWELGVPFAKGGADLRVHVGGLGSASEFYANDGAAVTTMGISASKTIEAGDSWGVPVSLSYVVNPDSDLSFLVFGVTLSP